MLNIELFVSWSKLGSQEMIQHTAGHIAIMKLVKNRNT
jgi:hypothetical protein